MNHKLDRDLERWGTGELSLEQLQHLHPRQDVAALTGVHTALTSLLEAPVPDAEAAWSRMASQLPARPSVAVRSRRLRRPAIVAIMAGVLAIPTVSYAAAPDAVRSAVRTVTDLIPGVNNDGAHHDKDDDGPKPATVDGQDDTADEQGPTEPAGTADTGSTLGGDPGVDVGEGDADLDADAGLGEDGAPSSPPAHGESGHSASAADG
jgi:hypothetical protein